MFLKFLLKKTRRNLLLSSKVMIKYVCFLALSLACGGQVSEPAINYCIFDGSYEAGRIATTHGCQDFVRVYDIPRTEDACDKSEDIHGSHLEVWCQPGDPVLECLGTIKRVDGCEFETYIRRIDQ